MKTILLALALLVITSSCKKKVYGQGESGEEIEVKPYYEKLRGWTHDTRVHRGGHTLLVFRQNSSGGVYVVNYTLDSLKIEQLKRELK